MLVSIKLLLWSGLIWPEGRRMEVPETTTDDALPWYPTGSLNLQNRTAVSTTQTTLRNNILIHFCLWLTVRFKSNINSLAALFFFFCLNRLLREIYVSLAVKYSSAVTNCACNGEQVVCSGFTENNLC